MKTEYKPIYKIAGKIQYLTEVLPQIETNTILCKTLTGLGATYSEIKAKRHSVIIVPNVPPIIGKCKDPKHKNDNLFYTLSLHDALPIIGRASCRERV